MTERRRGLRPAAAAAAVLAAAAALCGGEETHMTSGECDPLPRGWDYLGLVEGEAGPRPVASAAIRGAFAPPASRTPFVLFSSSISFAEGAIAFVDERLPPLTGGTADPQTVVRVTTLSDTAVLFSDRAAYEKVVIPAPVDSLFSWGIGDEWSAYEDVSDLATVDVTKHTCFPRHVVTDGTSIAWVDLADQTACEQASRLDLVPEEQRLWDVKLYTRGDAHSATLWDQVLLPDRGADAVHRVSPVLCQGTLLYLTVSEATNSSELVSFDLATRESHSVTTGEEGANCLAPRAWPRRDGRCGFAWIETGAAVALARAEADLRGPRFAGYTPANSSTAAPPGAGKSEFGARGFHWYPLALPVDRGALSPYSVVVDYRPGLETHRYGSDSFPGMHLENVLGGGGRLFLFFRTADGARVTAAAVQTDTDVVTLDVWQVAGTAGDPPVATPAGGWETGFFVYHNGTVVMRQLPTQAAADAGTAEALLDYSCHFRGRPWNETARGGDADALDYFAAYHDNVVYRRKDGVALERADLDKENDGVFDGQDRFPLHVMFQWDEDNDGIPDGEDIFEVHHACTEEILYNPSSCISDVTLMWIVWAAYTATLFAVAMGIGACRRHALSEGADSTADLSLSMSDLLDEESDIADALAESGHSDLQQILQLRHRLHNFRTLEVLTQTFLLSLTVFSVVLVIVPLWDRRPMTPRTIVVFTWIDVFTASVFACDLAFRYVYRDDREQTCGAFLKENWFDVPSLACDLPGVTSSGQGGGLDVLVVVRLLRLVRVLKIFRIMRLYRKVTKESAYLTFVLKYSGFMLPFFALLLLFSVAVVLKIAEQGGQDDFASYWNCLWFCFVTATTVGYGDMTPIHWIGRLLAGVLMVCGIGMIGGITAKVSERISQTGYQRAQEKEKQERLDEHPAIRMALLEMSVAFNPIVALKDNRKDYVDVLSKQFMTPRYMDAAAHRAPGMFSPTNNSTGFMSPHQQLDSARGTQSQQPQQQQQQKEGNSFERMDSGSTTGGLRRHSMGLTTAPEEVEQITHAWAGDGLKGGVLKAVYLSICKNEDNTQGVTPKQLAKAFKEHPEFLRLRRSVSSVEQSALDDITYELARQDSSMNVTWEEFEKAIVAAQRYSRSVAAETTLKNKYFDWYKWYDNEIVEKLGTMRNRRKSAIPKCYDKLFLLLLRHKLDKGYKGVEEWEKMYHRLKALIFKQPRKNGLVIEKLFSIGCFERGAGAEEDDPGELERMYDWQDPIDDTMEEAEKILRQHNVHQVEGFQEILLAVEAIVMQFDRLESTRWALHHLRWGKQGDVTLIPRPPLLQERGRTNVLNLFLHIPKMHRCAYTDPVTMAKCGRVLVAMRGKREAKQQESTEPVAERSFKDEDRLMCCGERCLGRRRLEARFSELRSVSSPLEEDEKGYLACPCGHYFLCHKCSAQSAEEAADIPFARSYNSFNSRSSFNSVSVKPRRERPFVRLSSSLSQKAADAHQQQQQQRGALQTHLAPPPSLRGRKPRPAGEEAELGVKFDENDVAADIIPVEVDDDGTDRDSDGCSSGPPGGGSPAERSEVG